VFSSYWFSERGKTIQKVTLPQTYSITSSREGSSQLSSPSKHFYSITEETMQSILPHILDRRGDEAVHFAILLYRRGDQAVHFASPPVILDRRGEEPVHPDRWHTYSITEAKKQPIPFCQPTYSTTTSTLWSIRTQQDNLSIGKRREEKAHSKPIRSPSGSLLWADTLDDAGHGPL